ncbi:hypothetical protein BJ875DRAFT_484042 [Amylocarpus encephaloides]|uniref:C2H2-type domain-containing protein n=1 Tax=Amylocarpus encephaloides TaxID=45428 RepID=A0A9P7YJE4_9HELO|nr:hypothetical protein BJ875DRAFT_484042 [Amylocarpus encephaloides]
MGFLEATADLRRTHYNGAISDHLSSRSEIEQKRWIAANQTRGGILPTSTPASFQPTTVYHQYSYPQYQCMILPGQQHPGLSNCAGHYIPPNYGCPSPALTQYSSPTSAAIRPGPDFLTTTNAPSSSWSSLPTPPNITSLARLPLDQSTAQPLIPHEYMTPNSNQMPHTNLFKKQAESVFSSSQAGTLQDLATFGPQPKLNMTSSVQQTEAPRQPSIDIDFAQFLDPALFEPITSLPSTLPPATVNPQDLLLKDAPKSGLLKPWQLKPSFMTGLHPECPPGLERENAEPIIDPRLVQRDPCRLCRVRKQHCWSIEGRLDIPCSGCFAAAQECQSSTDLILTDFLTDNDGSPGYILVGHGCLSRDLVRWQYESAWFSRNGPWRCNWPGCRIPLTITDWDFAMMHFRLHHASQCLIMTEAVFRQQLLHCESSGFPKSVLMVTDYFAPIVPSTGYKPLHTRKTLFEGPPIDRLTLYYVQPKVAEEVKKDSETYTLSLYNPPICHAFEVTSQHHQQYHSGILIPTKVSGTQVPHESSAIQPQPYGAIPDPFEVAEPPQKLETSRIDSILAPQSSSRTKSTFHCLKCLRRFATHTSLAVYSRNDHATQKQEVQRKERKRNLRKQTRKNYSEAAADELGYDDKDNILVGVVK